MLQLPKEIKRELFNLLKEQREAFGPSESQEGILPFLDHIWDLRSLPSTDHRFQDGYGDIYQHTVNNSDWTDDQLFIDILKLLDNDEKYNAFIEAVVNPAFRRNEDDIIKFVLLINPYLKKYNYALVLIEYNPSGVPVYRISEKGERDDLPVDLKENDIPFLTDFSPSGRNDRASSHQVPQQFPAFVLVWNSGWNDYSVRSSFHLFYYNENREGFTIGPLKIISNGDENDTPDVLRPTFTILGDEYCSLGQTEEYYRRLKEILGREFESVLFALKDSAFFPDIHDRFSNNDKFINSIVRFDGAERLLRVARYVVYNYDLANLYKFKYAFQPLYSSETVNVDFEFDNDIGSQNRIYAIIGKNGTGKTQLITSLPNNISRKKEEYFIPMIPFFSKVIAVSYSVFDQFEIPKRTSSFNYVYCGIRNDKNEEISEKGLLLRFHHSWKRIEELKRTGKWRNILLNFISQDIVDSFIVEDGIQLTAQGEYKFNIDGFHLIRSKLSSGQSIVLYIISQIVANIRLDSLLLYDEPETHLHPNAITELMNTIYELVKEFESYCIIATHSPMIIRELFSRNVYVIDRHENTPSVRRIGIESFGENISVLTDEVFGNKTSLKQYKKIIEELVSEGKSFEGIVELLEFDQMPLSLNTRLYIKSVIKDRDA